MFGQMEANTIAILICIGVVFIIPLFVFFIKDILPIIIDTLKDGKIDSKHKRNKKRNLKRYMTNEKERYEKFIDDVKTDFSDWHRDDIKKIVLTVKRLLKIMAENNIGNGNIKTKELIIKNFEISRGDSHSVQNLELKKRYEYAYEIIKGYSEINKLNKCAFFFQVFLESLYLALRATSPYSYIYVPLDTSSEMLRDIKKWIKNDKFIDFCPFDDFIIDRKNFNKKIEQCEIRIEYGLEREKEFSEQAKRPLPPAPPTAMEKIKNATITGLGYATLAFIKVLDKVTEDSPTSSNEKYELKEDSLGTKYLADEHGNRITDVSHIHYDGSITGTNGETYQAKK